MTLRQVEDLLWKAETGDADACLALATAWWSGNDLLAQNEYLANLYLNRYYFTRCAQLVSASIESPSAAALQQLLDTHYESGRAGDCIIPQAYCPICEDADELDACIFTGASACGTVENFLGYAIRCVENVCKSHLPPCTTCGGATRAAAADFVSPYFHETDYFIVRVLLGEDSSSTDYAALWWSHEGFIAMNDEIPDESEHCLMSLERAARLFQEGLPELATTIIKYAFENYDGDPDLVHATTLLAQTTESDLSEKIVRSHIQNFPSDPLGHLHLAEVLLRYRTFAPDGTTNTSVVEAAMHRVKESLRLRPQWREALLMQCILMSISSTSVDAVVTAYRKLLRLFPDFGAAHFDFSLYCTQVMPELSGQHYQKAYELSPTYVPQHQFAASPANLDY